MRNSHQKILCELHINDALRDSMESIDVVHEHFSQGSGGEDPWAPHVLGKQVCNRFPVLSDKSTIKPIEITSQGFTGLATDCSYSREGASWADFSLKHPQDSWPHKALSFFIFGHQNCLFTKWRFFTNPKCRAVFML